ncbi:hypothetical protein A20C1_09414 [marine actinobacterium PHSC20C1]|nr:hypothetical protein A20C1_09414 [marine actinobacterium PHSC20C1]
MPAITRTWIAFAAVGTGLIHVALVIGSPLALGIPLAILGVTEFAWGIVAFTRDKLPFARAAMVTAVSPLIAWGLLVTAAITLQTPTLAAVLDVVPWGIAAIFQLFVAGMLSLHARREREGKRTSAATPGAARYLVALMLGALAVSALTTPALAATEAGIYAQPHGEHDDSFTPQRDAPTSETGEDLFTVPLHEGH